MKTEGAETATIIPARMFCPQSFRTLANLFTTPEIVYSHSPVVGSEVALMVEAIPWGWVVVKQTVFGNAIMDTTNWTTRYSYTGRASPMLQHLDEYLPGNWRGLEFHVKHRRIGNRHQLRFGVMRRSFNYASGNDDTAWETTILWFDPMPNVSNVGGRTVSNSRKEGVTP